MLMGSQSYHLKPLFPTPRVPALPFTFRFKDTVILRVKEKPFTVFASNSNPSGGDPLQEKTRLDKKANDAALGRPFLAISAGFLVFFLVFWIVGSIGPWLIGFIVKLPPLKLGLFLCTMAC